MSKASAIAFAAVMLFIIIASYIVYLNIQSDLQRGVPLLPTEILPREAFAPASIIPSPTPQKPSPDTLTPSRQPSPTSPSPTPAATPSPATPTAISTTGVRPEISPSPAPTPANSYAFQLDGTVHHDLQAACTAQYIRGTVRDLQGNPLEGVRIQASDQWGNQATTTSKGGIDAGKWDIVLGSTPNIWNVVVLDSAGHPISPVVVVPHHQQGEFEAACTHIVDWRRVW